VGVSSFLGTIESSFATGNVIATGNVVGGLVGMNRQSMMSMFGTGVCISNSHSTGNVTGNQRVGGLVGWNHNDAEIVNSYAVGNVAGETAVGALVGTNNGKIIASYALQQTGMDLIGSNWGTTSENSGLKTEAQMKEQSTFVGWDFVDIWAILSSVNSGFPHLIDLRGEYDRPRVQVRIERVRNEQDLRRIAEQVNSGQKSFSGYTIMLINNIELVADENKQWIPIGNSDMRPFRGTFDGNGRVIRGVFIDNSSQDYAGLFGVIAANGAVKNLGVFVDIAGGNYVGGLAGRNDGLIARSYAVGNVAGKSQVGGLVGVNNEATIQDSYSTANVMGYSRVGGLVGLNEVQDRRSTIMRSYATGNATANGGFGSGLGGLVGREVGGLTQLSYFSSSTSGGGSVGSALTLGEMRNRANYSGWDFDGVWGISENINCGLPHLRVLAGSYASAHILGELQTITQVCCTQDGKIARICFVCNELADIEIIPALDHSFDGWIITREPTCDVAGEEERVCQRECCNHKDVNSIDILDCPDETPPSADRLRSAQIREYGILLERPIVSDFARISVILPEDATINLRILDNLGNTAFSVETQCLAFPICEIFWDLRNTAGRFVANGTYLIIIEARGRNGRIFMDSARIGVQQ
jgi:hypothetical protein